MLTRTAGILFSLALTGAPCFGQSTFQEITPGASTRSDVVKVLGQPLRTIDKTRFEYKPPTGIARVEVDYGRAASRVERMDVYFLRPVSRSALLKKFKLPQQPKAKSTNAEGKRVEYFGDPSLLALTYASADADSGVNQISYYSRNLFASTVAKAPGARQNPATQSSPSDSGSGAHGLPPLNLPAEMLPPGSTSASVDRTGRTSTSGGNPPSSGSDATKPATTTTHSSPSSDGSLPMTSSQGASTSAPPESSTSRFGPKEDNTSLDGTTLTYYPRSSVDECQSDCANNGNCEGFGWIRPGAYNPGDSAMCYLLSAVTRKIPHPCCISAVKGGGPAGDPNR